jgi:hypothetical protein
MKIHPFSPLAILLKAGCLVVVTILPSAPAKGADTKGKGDLQAPEDVPFRDVATSAKLQAAFRQVRLADPASKFEPATGDDPSITGAPKDIVKESDILSYNGVATLLPKGSVIFVPEILKSRVGWQENAQLVTWSQFFQNNRGWISTMEIDFEQAKGVAPIEEEKATWLGTSTKLVVATFKKGPITMLPPKAPETESTAETARATESPASTPAPAKAPKPSRFNFKR